MGDDLDDIPLTETDVSNRLKRVVVYALLEALLSLCVK